MKLSDKLLVIAHWLDNSENELLVDAESHEGSLSVVANALAKASAALKEGAEEVGKTEETLVTPESLDEIAAVAESFDASGDELLKKQASVLDEILLTLSAPRNYIFDFKKAEEIKIDVLKKKYKDIKEQHDDMNKVSDQIKAIEKSDAYKTYRPLEAPLSTRTCPDHPGAQISRVGENTWQCAMDKKVYNYDSGYTTLQGNKVPGGNVENQTPNHHEEGHMVFDTRNSKLGLE